MIESSNRLGIVDLVTNQFAFLTREGFTQTVEKGGLIFFYKSNDVWISITHGHLDYTLSVEIGRLTKPDESFTLQEVVEALCPDRTKESAYQASNAKSLAKGVAQFADLVKTCASPLLDANDPAYERVAHSSRAGRVKYTLEAQYGVFKREANEAWERKDFDKAQELYEQAKPALSATEEQRLQFLAKKKRK